MTSLGYLKGPRAGSGRVQMICNSSGHQAAERVRGRGGLDKGQLGRAGAKPAAVLDGSASLY